MKRSLSFNDRLYTCFWGLLCVFLSGSPVWAYSGGQGTAADPYQLARSQDLVTLSLHPDDWDMHFVLTADIDLQNQQWSQAPIGEFSGVLDGQNHVIRRLRIMGQKYLGLIGTALSDAVVQRVGVVDSAVTASQDYAGLLVGENHGIIRYCYANGAVEGRDFVGGLVGRNYEGWVGHCLSAGSVSGKNYVGGLLGQNGDYLTRSKVIRCRNAAKVEGQRAVGGLVGDNYGDVTECLSIGAVDGRDVVGGLVGFTWEDLPGSKMTATVSRSFWDTETSGLEDSSGGTGLTSEELKIEQTFLDTGWDFVDEFSNGLHETWQMPQQGGYPELAIYNGYEPPVLPGNGSCETPYELSDAATLGAAIYYDANACYILTEDIDVNNITWSSSVLPVLQGLLEGDGYDVSNLSIRGASQVGLVGWSTCGAHIQNLGVVDANIAALSDHVGVLAGVNDGVIARCFSTGQIRGNNMVGGITGSNGCGLIVNSYSQVAVRGENRVGGLTGENGALDSTGALLIGECLNCYSTGAVDGFAYDGGLMGENWTSIVTACFWDIETSDQFISAAGEGRNTVDLQRRQTFVSAGWDFEGESVNGTEDIWTIDDGQDYPRLWWESLP